MICSFFVAQYAAHTGGGYKASRRRQRPGRLISLAGFQVTINGRFWLTPKGMTSHFAARNAGAMRAA
jgi:hypothetical protein